MVKTSMSHEDYLEAIVMLGGTTDVPVRSVDVANKLGVSKASVNKAISALKEQELVIQPHYGDITLTEEGMILRKRAEEIMELVKKAEDGIALAEELVAGDITVGAGETDGLRVLVKAVQA